MEIMKKIQISYETKFDLIKAYIEGNLPENEFNSLCERVEGFKHQYEVQRKNYEKIKKVLEPRSAPVEAKSAVSLVFHNISEAIKTFPEFISEVTKDIQQIFTHVELQVEYARSAGEENDEVRKELQFKTVEDVSNSISELVEILYHRDNVSRIELKFDFYEQEKYLEIDKNGDMEEVTKKVIDLIEKIGFDKLDRVNVFII